MCARFSIDSIRLHARKGEAEQRPRGTLITRDDDHAVGLAPVDPFLDNARIGLMDLVSGSVRGSWKRSEARQKLDEVGTVVRSGSENFERHSAGESSTVVAGSCLAELRPGHHHRRN